MEIICSPAECVYLLHVRDFFPRKTLNAFHLFIISNTFYFYIM